MAAIEQQNNTTAKWKGKKIRKKEETNTEYEIWKLGLGLGLMQNMKTRVTQLLGALWLGAFI